MNPAHGPIAAIDPKRSTRIELTKTNFDTVTTVPRRPTFQARTLRRHTLHIGKQFSDAAVEKPPIAAAATAMSLDSTFVRSCEDGERQLEVRVGNIETETGGRQVFGGVTRAETDITALIQRTLETVGRTGATKVTAFTDACPGLRTVLTDAGVTKPPILDWFHIAMRLQHTKLTAANLSTDDTG
jgi:hypothetical protein